jgi:hypothetical protein
MDKVKNLFIRPRMPVLFTCRNFLQRCYRFSQHCLESCRDSGIGLDNVPIIDTDRPSLFKYLGLVSELVDTPIYHFLRYISTLSGQNLCLPF